MIKNLIENGKKYTVSYKSFVTELNKRHPISNSKHIMSCVLYGYLQRVSPHPDKEISSKGMMDQCLANQALITLEFIGESLRGDRAFVSHIISSIEYYFLKRSEHIQQQTNDQNSSTERMMMYESINVIGGINTLYSLMIDLFVKNLGK